MPRLPTYANRSYLEFIGPRYWSTWISVAFLRVTTLLPLPVLWIVGSAFGILAYYLIPSRRKIATTNITRCFPDLSPRQLKRLIKRHYRALGQAVFDTAIGCWASERRLRRLVRCRNREFYDRALADKRRIVLLMGHFVAIEVGGLFLSMERPLIDIYKKPSSPLWHLLVLHGLNRSKQATLVEKLEGLTPVISALRQGEPLCYLPDQDPGRQNSVFVPFLGMQETATVSILGRLAKVTNAVVIPCYTRQLPFGRGYEVIFKPPLENYPTGDEIEDTRRMNEEIEKVVRKMPEQYFWVHRRFKTRPEGEAGLYT